MNIKKTIPTRGQLERQLSQAILTSYRQQFAHVPSKIICRLFADQVAIVVEDAVTNVEKILFNNSQPDLARSIRLAVSEIFTTKVKELTTEILKVGVIDIIVDSVIDTGYLGIIIFLDSSPQVRLAKRKSSIDQD